MPKIPDFKSAEEEAKFWETHDTTEFMDELEEVAMVIMDRTPMKPLSLVQWLLSLAGQTFVRYPEGCRLCGQKTEGNRLLGFSLPCSNFHAWSREDKRPQRKENHENRA